MKIGFDILFLAIVAGCGVGGFFLGDERAQRLMLGSLVGVFAATLLAPALAKLLNSVAIANITNISFALLAISIVIFVAPKRLRDKKWPKNKPRAVISGVLSGLFILSFGIGFLSQDTRTALVTDHNLAAMAYDLRLFVLGVLLIWLAITMLFVGKAKNS